LITADEFFFYFFSLFQGFDSELLSIQSCI
jgi:hypothetical protein